MVLPLRNKPKYEYLKIVNNSIGSEGCMHISKADWPLLKTIQLGKYEKK